MAIDISILTLGVVADVNRIETSLLTLGVVADVNRIETSLLTLGVVADDVSTDDRRKQVMLGSF